MAPKSFQAGSFIKGLEAANKVNRLNKVGKLLINI